VDLKPPDDVPIALAARWEWYFAKLIAFKARFGHWRVPKRGRKDLRLANWVAFQRKLQKMGKLEPERFERLHKIGFQWEPRVDQAHLWSARLAQLVAFKARFGHCDVPALWAEDPAFAHWVHNQRIYRRSRALIPERCAQLDQLGFRWQIRTAGRIRWSPRAIPGRALPKELAALDQIWEKRLAELRQR